MKWTYIIDKMLPAFTKIIRGKITIAAIVLFVLFYTLSIKTVAVSGPWSLEGKSPSTFDQPAMPLWEQTLDFEKLNFDNRTGNPAGCYLVPNYVHYVIFGGKPIDYLQLVGILAAFKNQRPEKMFFHHDDNNTFTGKYWEVLEKTPGFSDIVVFKHREMPSEIFGQPLSDGWQKWHGSDITRIRVLIENGGIYLDNDCYLVKSIDDYRRFEMTLNWDDNGQFMGSQVLIAHKDARFLKKYLDTYRVYDRHGWYYNAGERPTKEVLYTEPELIHRVKLLFGVHIQFAYKTLQQQWDGWRDMYVIHLLSHHQYLFKNLSSTATFPVEFNENNIANYDITFREMAYDVYDVANIKWPKKRT